MRILVFGMSGRLTGGIETFLLNMNAEMSNDCIFDYVIMDGKNVHSGQIKKRGGGSFIVTPVKRNPLKSFIQLNSVIRKNRYNHPVAYFNLFSMVHVVPVMLCIINGYRIVLHAHNSRLQQKSRLYYILHLTGRFLLKKIKCVQLTNSKESALFMFGKNNKAGLIYNAIDVDRFRFNMKGRNEIRTKYGIEEKIVVGYSGRLSELKNPVFLVDIFKEFHQLCNNSVLLIAGDGELREVVERRIKEYGLSKDTILAGTVENIDDYYMAFDLFIMPSKSEGLGIALVEAQTSGLPVVTSKDTVPDIATVTERCIRVSLENTADVWAKAARDLYVKTKNSGNDRNVGYDVVRKTNYNIKKESGRLERVLLGAGSFNE